LVAQGTDPRAHHREQRQAAVMAVENWFASVFQRWRDYKALSLEKNGKARCRRLTGFFPRMCCRGLGPYRFQVTRTELVQVLRRVERRGALSTAEKLRTWFNQLFRYAMVEVNLETNPAGELDMVALPQPPVSHNPYLTMGEMPPFLGKLRRYGGDINTRLGIRLLLLTGVRTIELRSATPEQFKLGVGLWIIPCATVKQCKCGNGRNERKSRPTSCL
jgi:integrase